MCLADVLNRVDGERIYKHVLELEGTRHPIDAPQKMNEAADYIYSEFKRYGLAVNEQAFSVEGFDGSFRNVEGLIGDGVGPELLVVSHYDTVADCPGANDNASAVAIMLETARVLMEAKGAKDVRFISFALEELNPAHVLHLRNVAKRLQLLDEHQRYTSLHTSKVMKRLLELRRKGHATGKDPAEAVSDARSQLGGQMTAAENEYAREMEHLLEGVTLSSLLGKDALMGSNFWIEQALRSNRKILGVFCLDTVGYTSEKEHSQLLPKGIDKSIFQTHNITDVSIGNFLSVIGSMNSGDLLQSFCAQCKLGSVDLPYACLQVPVGFEVVAKMMFDLLRSDHAPFWRKEIPTVFLTDTTEFRYPYYHTQADTIDKLDFDFITKVCKATVATVIDLTHK